jgi:hypothetical protein
MTSPITAVMMPIAGVPPRTPAMAEKFSGKEIRNSRPKGT